MLGCQDSRSTPFDKFVELGDRQLDRRTAIGLAALAEEHASVAALIGFDLIGVPSRTLIRLAGVHCRGSANHQRMLRQHHAMMSHRRKPDETSVR